MRKNTCLAATVLACAIVAPCRAVDHHVPADYPTIQAAVEAADNNDVIFVGPGIYDETIIDAGGNGSVIRITGGQSSGTRIEGFTLTGGTGSPMPSGRATRGQTIGGAAFIANASDPVFSHCIMHGNSATDGGALYVSDSSSPDCYNCLIYNNTASDEGGAVYASQALPSLFHSTIAGNQAATGGAMYVTDQSFPLFNNSIVWDNGATPVVASGSSTVFYSFSNVQLDGEQVPAGGGNINTDPRFLNPALHRYELNRGSPCVDAGDSFGLWSAATDLAGNARAVDDAETPDTGEAWEGSPVADMGAFEYQSTQYSCTGDLNADGVVNVTDLLEVVVRWGQAYNVADLLDVIIRWGNHCGD